MKILLDKSPAALAEYSVKHGFEFWQLRTPLTQHARASVPYGLDNGCFSRFEYNTWKRQLAQARTDPPLFACMPDIVGDARRTRELFDWFYDDALGVPKAFVLQDGIEHIDIPWLRISAVFVGGSDAFKVSPHAFGACRAARMMNKWIHVGRVNTVERLNNWLGVADSIDGTGLIKDERKLERILDVIRGTHPQVELQMEVE